MKNILKVDFSKNAIIMDRTFAKKCTDTRSEEYTQLQRVRQDYPSFAVLTRTIKRNENKETYKGLTYKYMEDYIRTHESEETASAVLEEFEELRLIAQCHAKAFRYPTIKKWFLEKYPNVKNFCILQSSIQEQTTVLEISADRPAALSA